MLEKLLLRPVLTFLLKLFFRVELRGLEHFKEAGEHVLIVANHQSFLDPLIIGVFLPEKPAFAINVFQAEKWYFRWLDTLATLYRLDPSKPLSMKRLMQDVKQGAKVVIFPEGRITTSGGVMRIYEGTGRIIEKTGAAVLPVRIDGAEYSKMSRLSRKLHQRWFPRIRMTILPPVRFPAGEAVTPEAIYKLMTDAAFAAQDWRRPFLSAVLDAYRLHGGGHVVAEDIARQGMGYRALFTRAFVLSGKLDGMLSSSDDSNSKYVALLLPNSLAAAVSFVALHMLGKIPCMLNFSAGEANILHACRIATVRTVITSRAFIEKGKLETIAAALEKEYRVIYLEDIRPQVTLGDKLAGLLQGGGVVHNIPAELRRRFNMPSLFALDDRLAQTDPDAPAVILYTSGSEGVPKGVALSHANLLANIAQVRARLDLLPSDIMFNALPVFHSFGLTGGLLLPLVSGVKTFLYPTPLHYRIIPDLVYDTDATIMLGTDTFYQGYAHYAHAYDFWNIRLAVAGAEKLRETTRRLYADTFHMHIFEGYGVTEASPVIAVNTPLAHKDGTVGRPLPAIECRIEPVAGLEQGGRLLIRGPNVMLGYLKADQPGVIQPQGEWYDTGDIVAIGEDGFIAIQGRAKRFAKIGGEMVSLLAVEEFAAAVLPEAAHAAIALPDERKGEQIFLITESAALTREQLVRHAKAEGLPELGLPRKVIRIDALPRLGNGKIDYVSLKERMPVLLADG